MSKSMLVLEASCPNCDAPLTEGQVVHLDAYCKDINQDGAVFLSAVFGDYSVKTDVQIPSGIGRRVPLPELRESVMLQMPCRLCGAPMASLNLKTGGCVEFCSRAGCKGHALGGFGDVDDMMTLVNTMLEYAARLGRARGAGRQREDWSMGTSGPRARTRDGSRAERVRARGLWRVGRQHSSYIRNLHATSSHPPSVPRGGRVVSCRRRVRLPPGRLPITGKAGADGFKLPESSMNVHGHQRYNFKNHHFVGEEGRLIPLLQQAQAEDGYLRRERLRGDPPGVGDPAGADLRGGHLLRAVPAQAGRQVPPPRLPRHRVPRQRRGRAEPGGREAPRHPERRDDARPALHASRRSRASAAARWRRSLMINNATFGNLSPSAAVKIVKKYQKGERS